MSIFSIKRTVALAAAITLGALAGTTSAQTPSGPGPVRGQGQRRFGDSKLAAALGISDAQKEQIHGILRSAQPTLQPLIESVIRERRALRAAIHASPVNEQAIRAQSARVAGVEADLAVQRASLHQKIQAVLTPEQIQRIQQMRASVEKKVDERISHLEEWIGGSGTQQ